MLNIQLYCWFHFSEKPSIDASGIKDITVRAGEVIKISIPIKGWPLPTTSWELGDTPIIKDGRTQMETKDDAVQLIIKSAERKDTGPYTVRLKNAAGTAEAQVNVIVLGMHMKKFFGILFKIIYDIAIGYWTEYNFSRRCILAIIALMQYSVNNGYGFKLNF